MINFLFIYIFSLKRRTFDRQSGLIKPYAKFAFAGESTNDENNKLYERSKTTTNNNNSKFPQRQAIDSILFYIDTIPIHFIIVSTRSKYTYGRSFVRLQPSFSPTRETPYF